MPLCVLLLGWGRFGSGHFVIGGRVLSVGLNGTSRGGLMMPCILYSLGIFCYQGGGCTMGALSPPFSGFTVVYWVRGTDVQGYWGYRGTEVQRYKGTEVQRYRGTEVQRYRGTEVQRYRGTEVQR